MSSTESSSDASSIMSDNEYLSESEEMFETQGEKRASAERAGATACDNTTTSVSVESSDEPDAPSWLDDPIANDEWTARYYEDVRKREILQRTMLERLDGTAEITEWCKCGNCKRQDLTKWDECYCCHELDGCMEALSSDIVKQDLTESDEPTCITEHPGFRPVCLEKWSLRMSAWHFKTRNRKRYEQGANEDRFLRSVAYREFTRMVYGVIGRKRIPLPACAYNAIRKTFPLAEEGDMFSGFEKDDDDI